MRKMVDYLRFYIPHDGSISTDEEGSIDGKNGKLQKKKRKKNRKKHCVDDTSAGDIWF